MMLYCLLQSRMDSNWSGFYFKMFPKAGLGNGKIKLPNTYLNTIINTYLYLFKYIKKNDVFIGNCIGSTLKFGIEMTNTNTKVFKIV